MLIRPVCIETTALGDAYLAGLAVKLWKSVDEIQGQWAVDRIFEREIPEHEKVNLISGWNKAVSRARNWEE